MLENHISLMHGIKNPDLSQMAKAKAPERDRAEVTNTYFHEKLNVQLNVLGE